MNYTNEGYEYFSYFYIGYFIFVREGGIICHTWLMLLLSPVVGGTMLAASVGVAAYSIKRLKMIWMKRKSRLWG